MKTTLIRGGLVAALAAGALAVPLTPTALAGPADVGYCYNEPPSEVNPTGVGQTCTAWWYADVNGEYAVAVTGSWEVQKVEPICTGSGSTRACGEEWVTITSGGDTGYATSGALTAGNTYQLVVNGTGSGELGSISGTGTI